MYFLFQLQFLFTFVLFAKKNRKKRFSSIVFLFCCCFISNKLRRRCYFCCYLIISSSSCYSLLKHLCLKNTCHLSLSNTHALCFIRSLNSSFFFFAFASSFSSISNFFENFNFAQLLLFVNIFYCCNFLTKTQSFVVFVIAAATP